jgi:hypothetical protein
MTPELHPCPDCGVAPGEEHHPHCDVARCLHHGGQRLGCVLDNIAPDEPDGHDCGKDVWTGEWPGDAECREFGWYARRNPAGPGYLPCDPHDDGAVPDLNRLVTEATWDPEQGRFVR